MNKATILILINLLVIAALVADQYVLVGDILEHAANEEELKSWFGAATSRLTNTFLIANALMLVVNLLLYKNWAKSKSWLLMSIGLMTFNFVVCFANFSSSMEKVQLQMEAFQQEEGKIEAEE
jgi:hypothetical protein